MTPIDNLKNVDSDQRSEDKGVFSAATSEDALSEALSGQRLSHNTMYTLCHTTESDDLCENSANQHLMDQSRRDSTTQQNNMPADQSPCGTKNVRFVIGEDDVIELSIDQDDDTESEIVVEDGETEFVTYEEEGVVVTIHTADETNVFFLDKADDRKSVIDDEENGTKLIQDEEGKLLNNKADETMDQDDIGQDDDTTPAIGRDDDTKLTFGQNNETYSSIGQYNETTPSIYQDNIANLSIDQDNETKSVVGQYDETTPTNDQDGETKSVIGQDIERNASIGQDIEITSSIGQDNEITSSIGQDNEVTSSIVQDNEITSSIGQVHEITSSIGQDNEITSSIGQDNEITSSIGQVNEITSSIGQDCETKSVLGKFDETKLANDQDDEAKSVLNVQDNVTTFTICQDEETKLDFNQENETNTPIDQDDETKTPIGHSIETKLVPVVGDGDDVHTVNLLAKDVEIWEDGLIKSIIWGNYEERSMSLQEGKTVSVNAQDDDSKSVISECDQTKPVDETESVMGQDDVIFEDCQMMSGIMENINSTKSEIFQDDEMDAKIISANGQYDTMLPVMDKYMYEERKIPRLSTICYKSIAKGQTPPCVYAAQPFRIQSYRPVSFGVLQLTKISQDADRLSLDVSHSSSNKMNSPPPKKICPDCQTAITKKYYSKHRRSKKCRENQALKEKKTEHEKNSIHVSESDDSTTSTCTSSLKSEVSHIFC